MKREFSAGGIVLKGNQVLLIKNAAMRDPNKAYWGFPKGHIDEGEKSIDAALREVKEETGLEVKILKKLGDSSCVFTNKEGEKVFKVVIYFLMEFMSGEIKAQDLEIMEAGWYEITEALEKLSFKKDKDFLEKVKESLGER